MPPRDWATATDFRGFSFKFKKLQRTIQGSCRLITAFVSTPRPETAKSTLRHNLKQDRAAALAGRPGLVARLVFTFVLDESTGVSIANVIKKGLR